MGHSLAKESIIYGLGSILTRSLGLILIPLYTNHLTISEYGMLALLNLILQAASYFCVLGIGSATMRLYYDKDQSDDRRGRLYGNALVMILFISPLAVVGLCAPVYFLADQFLPSIPFMPYILVMLLVAGLSPMMKLVAGLLRVHHLPVSFITLHIAFFVFQALTIYFAVVVMDMGLKGQVYAQLVANALFWIISVVILVRHSRPTISAPVMREMFGLGIKVLPFLIFAWISTASGRFILERFTSLEEVGVFALSAQFAGLLMLLATSFDNAMMPHFYRAAGEGGAEESLGKLTLKYTALFGVFGVAVSMFAPSVIIVVANYEYYEAIDHVIWLVLANWIFIVAKPFTWSLLHSKRNATLSSVKSAVSIFQIILLMLLVWGADLGIAGVVYSMIISNFLNAILMYIVAQKYYCMKIPWGRFFAVTGLLSFVGLYVGITTTHLIDVSWLGINLLVFIVVAIFTLRIAGYRKISELLRG